MSLEPWNLDSVFDEKSVRAAFEIYDGDTNDYRDYKQFLIFDECDIDCLIKVLQWAKNGCPDDVNLIDVLEMICDCVCAGLARSGEVRDLEISTDILERAVQNTVQLLVDNIEVVDKEEE